MRSIKYPWKNLTKKQRSVRKKLMITRRTCACIPMVAEHLHVLDVARIVCDFLEKMTDRAVLYQCLTEYPFGWTERIEYGHRRFKKYKNPFAQHKVYIRLFAEFDRVYMVWDLIYTFARHVRGRINGALVDRVYDDIFTRASKYTPDIMFEPELEKLETANCWGWKYMMSEHNTQVRINRRIIAAIWGCPYRHVCE